MAEGAEPAETVAACFDLYADLLRSDPGFACPIAATVVDLHDDEPAVVALADESSVAPEPVAEFSR